MKSHSVKSNAKRAARKLAERFPGLVAVEPLMADGGGWYAVVGAVDSFDPRSVPMEARADVEFFSDAEKHYGWPTADVAMVEVAATAPVSLADLSPSPLVGEAPDVECTPQAGDGAPPRQEATICVDGVEHKAALTSVTLPTADPLERFAADREALASFKKGDPVEFDQPGTFRQKDGTKKEGRTVRGVVDSVTSRDLGTIKVLEGKADWCVRASRLRPASDIEEVEAPAPVLPAAQRAAVATELAELPPPVKSSPEEIAARRAERRARIEREKAEGLRTPAGEKVAPPKPEKAPTRADIIIATVSRPEGATVQEVADACGWQKHTVRGYIGGTLRKRGVNIVARRSADGPARYFLVTGEAAE